MEHLATGRPPPIVVPYLLPDDFEYDIGGFESYPERKGWKFEQWLTRSPGQGIGIPIWLDMFNPTKSAEELVSFLQAWLFFGFLSETLAFKLELSRFLRICEKTGRKMITTQHLPQYMAIGFLPFETRPISLRERMCITRLQ